MRIAVVQFAPKYREKVKNLEALTALCHQASAGGAKIVVLPELCTTGYTYMSAKEALPDAEVLGLESPTLSTMLEIAQATRMVIIWGMIELDEGSGKLYNSQVLMKPNGKFESYKKLNFFGNDYLWGTPGTATPPIVSVGAKKVGLLICRDVRDKSHDLETIYSKGDAQIVCLSANWGAGAFPANSWMDFAKNNDCYLAVSNRYGKEANLDFGHGGVGIISPDGVVQCEGLAWDQDCVVFGDVP